LIGIVSSVEGHAFVTLAEVLKFFLGLARVVRCEIWGCYGGEYGEPGDGGSKLLSESSVSIYQTTRCSIPRDSHLQLSIALFLAYFLSKGKYHAVCGYPLFQLLNHLSDFYETWYDHYAIG
jgi:hypothetical protein